MRAISTRRASLLAERLRQARREARRSQKDAARCVGVDRTTIARAELGQHVLHVGTLTALAALYDKPIQWFFENGTEPAHASQ